MRTAHKYILVMVTAPDLKAARQIVRQMLRDRLAACGNLLPKLESHYWWQGKIQTSAEVLILFKTTAARLDRLEKRILALHPYDTPEILALPVEKGTARYLKWLAASVNQTP